MVRAIGWKYNNLGYDHSAIRMEENKLGAQIFMWNDLSKSDKNFTLKYMTYIKQFNIVCWFVPEVINLY